MIIGSFTTLDDYILRHSLNFLIPYTNVILGLFDFLISTLLKRYFFVASDKSYYSDIH